MATMARGNALAAAICEAAGLKNVRSMTVRFDVDEVVTVEATVLTGDFSQFVLKRFRLSAEPIEEGSESPS